MTVASQLHRVLLVEDHPMFRDHLAALIRRELGLEVCGETDNIRDAIALIEQHNPHLIILDMTLRGSSGLELIKDIRSRGLGCQVLVLSMHDENLYAERALRAGALGYVCKNETSSEVIRAIRAVLEGRVHVSDSMNAKLLARMAGGGKKTVLGGLDRLADREIEVFHLLGRGLSTREIAGRLALGESTVETYRARIKEKLNLRSAAELYLRAGEWVRENGG